MKKLFAMILAMMMVLSLAACGGEKEPAGNQQVNLGQVTEATKGADTAEDATQAPEEVVTGTVFVFNYEGAKVIPAEPFDPSVLPEAASVYEVPSCALEGTDNLYNYESFEITAFNDGNGEVVYSIYFLDPNLTTTEGLALGDSLEKAVELYGENYEDLNGELVYTVLNTQLRLIVENDVVVSIEYRMVTG